jgi:hypothetical protein
MPRFFFSAGAGDAFAAVLEVLLLSVFLFKWEISFAASRTARTHAHLSRYELV